MKIIGYARVSTEDQSTDGQREELLAAGATFVLTENASGGKRDRKVLREAIDRLQRGDTLLIVRLDRLARSLTHLLDVIDMVEAKGAYFRSLRDPVDTSSPQGRFTMQVLGAAAELERALIRERTKSGLNAARRAGRIGGNPGVRAGDKAALRKIEIAKRDNYVNRVMESADQWMPEVQKMRPEQPWDVVLDTVNRRLPAGQKPWTNERLRRAVKVYVQEGFLDERVLQRAARPPADHRAMAVIAALVSRDPDMTLKEIAASLTRMRERTPRDSFNWSLSSVKMLRDRAESLGMIEAPSKNASTDKA